MMKTTPVSKWYLWVSAALVLKGLMFILFIYETGDFSKPFFGVVGGDTDSYLKPVESYINSGVYVPDYRMPGYGLIYYLLRMLMNPEMSCNALIIIQYFIAAISVYVLALTSFRVFKSSMLFYLVYFSFLISTYTSLFDIYLLTESFAVSASIFGLYYLIKGLDDNKPVSLLISGLFFTWLIFLRPVYVPYLPLAIFLILIFKNGDAANFRRKMLQMFLLLVPFIILDGIWLTRNYSLYKKVIPLQKSVYYPDASESYYADLMYFLQSWGGSYIFWDPTAEIRWFGIRGPSNDRQILDDRDVKIPDYIYTSQFTKDSLVMIRNMIMETRSDTISATRLTLLSDLLKVKLEKYTTSVKTEKTLLYQIKSRLIYFKKYLLHSGTYNLFSKAWSELGVFKKMIKLFYSFGYLFVLFTGIIGSIMLVFKKFPSLHIFFPVVSIYSIAIFPFIFRLPEIRYFVPAFPFMLVCSMYFTNEIIIKLKSIRQSAVKINIQ